MKNTSFEDLEMNESANYIKKKVISLDCTLDIVWLLVVMRCMYESIDTDAS